MFYNPLNRLTELNIVLANSQSAMERIFEVFNTSPEIVDRSTAMEIGAVKGDVKFVNVHFAYEMLKTALKDINLQIPAGCTVALVGPSGAGKSTFAKLIPRFYDVTGGEITIDGRDVRDIKLRCLRGHIATVPQEPILFSGTVYENILFGKSNVNEEDIRAATISANAHDFICKLPKGYQTEIGEGGLRLSGGQRQRIALARAFLKDAPILILDEATSSLDSKSENLIQEALKRLMKGRTTIIIAHRLSTIQSADMIVVFDNGEIVETGKHQELLQHPYGHYRQLFDEQFNKKYAMNNWRVWGMGIVIEIDCRERDAGIPEKPSITKDMVAWEQHLSVDHYCINKRINIEQKTNTDFIEPIFDGRLFSQVSCLKWCTEISVMVFKDRSISYRFYNGSQTIKGVIIFISIPQKMPLIFL